MIASNTRARFGTAILLGVATGVLGGCQRGQPPASAPGGDAAEEIPIGYGTQEARDVTGAVSSLDARDLRREGATRLEEVIQGSVAGVRVIRLPNGDFAIRIRGTSTLLGSAEPLYVLDGMPMQPTGGGTLAGINPADVARIEVLKDAAATAIYGVRGANGVVLITTKRGH